MDHYVPALVYPGFFPIQFQLLGVFVRWILAKSVNVKDFPGDEGDLTIAWVDYPHLQPLNVHRFLESTGCRTWPGGFLGAENLRCLFLPSSEFFQIFKHNKNHHICTRLQVFAKQFCFNNQIVGKHPSRNVPGFAVPGILCVGFIVSMVALEKTPESKWGWLTFSGWWFQTFLIFNANLGEMIHLTCAYFSNGLKPPTSFPFSVAGWNFWMSLFGVEVLEGENIF